MRRAGSASSRLVVADARQRSVGPALVGDDLVPRSVVRLQIDSSVARSVLHCHSSSTPWACRGSVARVGAALQTRQLRFDRYEPGDYPAFWKFQVDWANPANSTFGINGDPNYKLPVAAFVRPQCVYGYGPNCVVQKGGPQGLDVLGDRLMFRMPIRSYGKYESVALNHTVVANGTDGIRWYEVRIPKGGGPSIYQQGTYAPADSATNPLYRWMGSVAMDKAGDLALGYSASGPNDYPSVRYTGRAAADPLDQLAQAEKVAFTGTGPQTEVEGQI